MAKKPKLPKLVCDDQEILVKISGKDYAKMLLEAYDCVECELYDDGVEVSMEDIQSCETIRAFLNNGVKEALAYCVNDSFFASDVIYELDLKTCFPEAYAAADAKAEAERLQDKLEQQELAAERKLKLEHDKKFGTPIRLNKKQQAKALKLLAEAGIEVLS